MLLCMTLACTEFMVVHNMHNRNRIDHAVCNLTNHDNTSSELQTGEVCAPYTITRLRHGTEQVTELLQALAAHATTAIRQHFSSRKSKVGGSIGWKGKE